MGFIFTLVVILLLLVVEKVFLPCPNPNPPISLAGSFATNWSLVLYVCCGFYAVVGLQTASTVLPIMLLAILVFLFTSIDEFAYAHFLAIHLVISIFYSLAIAGVITATESIKKLSGFTKFIIALLVGFVLPLYTYSQALGYANSIC